MAKFEGIHWASQQMRYTLADKKFDLLEPGAGIYAVSRSVHYAIFLCFEGIRFFCKKNEKGNLEVVFLNWHMNLERFRRGISFNLGSDQQDLVPDIDELENIFIRRYFSDASMRPFLEEMAALGAQGYLRPFTVDEERSIGVTFPNEPAIRAVASRYDRYLGEPFCGVAVPHLVRAVGVNKTGCLKLGINYLISVKAIDAAKRISPDAAVALFLDDRPDRPIEKREISEWDSSCCLFGLSDGTVVKIPESDLILPSVTIQGITGILSARGIRVEERPFLYGELVRRAEAGELAVACSVGTAGILNRCQKLVLVDENLGVRTVHKPAAAHPLYQEMGKVREFYWGIYKEKVPLPAGMRFFKYAV